jgi:SEC-C motif domain protein
MRSRYTAFVLANSDYLLATWHPSTRPPDLTFDLDQHWIGLKIIACREGQTDDTQGQVEFLARYKIHGRAYRLHETSRFLRLAEGWLYLDGDVRNER